MLTVGTPSVLCLEHLQREASRGILPGAWTTSHSGSCFCGGVTVQYWGLPHSLKPSHSCGGTSCPQFAAKIYLFRSQIVKSWLELRFRVQRKTNRLIKSIALWLTGLSKLHHCVETVSGSQTLVVMCLSLIVFGVLSFYNGTLAQKTWESEKERTAN